MFFLYMAPELHRAFDIQNNSLRPSDSLCRAISNDVSAIALPCLGFHSLFIWCTVLSTIVEICVPFSLGVKSIEHLF